MCRTEALEYTVSHAGTDHQLDAHVRQRWCQTSRICISKERGQPHEFLDHRFRSVFFLIQENDGEEPKSDSGTEKSPEEKEEEEEEEEEDYDDEADDNEDVQSFVTAQENDDITESLNGLSLGHDDEGERTPCGSSWSPFLCSGWITPANIKSVKARALDNGASDSIESVQETLPVACITTDFSMQVEVPIDGWSSAASLSVFSIQNVLIQMGLPLLSVDGLPIRTARSYVLECRACPG